MPPALSAARINLLLAPVGAVIGFFASILIARCLGPEIYADYATLMALVAWLLLLAEVGCNIGLGRFLPEALQANARGSLYLVLQHRRWAVSIALCLSLGWLGPIWAESAGLSVARWPPYSFIMVGLLAAVLLHGQLASSALLAVFAHRRVLLTQQVMNILRALVLALLAGMLREPVVMVAALLAVAMLEAGLLHHAVMIRFGKERGELPRGLANAAQRHGLVALFDKLTTALSGGPFLLLVLAGIYSRDELAMLAITTELLQKALFIVGLPVSNLVLPMLNCSRGDIKLFLHQITRLGGIVVLLFTFAAGGIMTALPAGLPLLLGESYAPALPLALIWLLPVFIESGVRMVWGAALMVFDQYRWLLSYNLFYGVGCLSVVLLAQDKQLPVLMTWLGVFRILMSLVLLGHATQLGLLLPESRPLQILLAVFSACLLSFGVQKLIPADFALARLSTGICVYLLVLLTALRLLPIVPEASHNALCQMAGKYQWLIKLFLHSPKDYHKNA